MNHASQLIIDSLKNVCDAVKVLVETANAAILEHNTMVSNLETERTELRGQVWRFLLDKEIKSDLETFTYNKTSIEKGNEGLKTRIKDKIEERRIKEQEIQTLEKDTDEYSAYDRWYKQPPEIVWVHRVCSCKVSPGTLLQDSAI